MKGIIKNLSVGSDFRTYRYTIRKERTILKNTLYITRCINNLLLFLEVILPSMYTRILYKTKNDKDIIIKSEYIPIGKNKSRK